MLIPMCAFLIELAHGLPSAALACGTLALAPGSAVRRKGSLMPDVSFTELPGRRVLVRRFRPEDVTELLAKCAPERCALVKVAAKRFE